MTSGSSRSDGGLSEELAALVATLHATGRRIEELTGGEVDGVAAPEGGTFLLRRAQDELRQREADKQAALLDAFPAHVAVLDAQGLIIAVNESWRRFAEVNALPPPPFAIGANYLRVCDLALGDNSSEAAAVARGIRSVACGETKSFSIEYPCHSESEERWFMLIVTPMSNDRPNGAFVVHLDISERKRAEHDIRENEERFAIAFEHAPIGMALVSVHGRWLRVNRALCELTGYSSADLLTLTFQQMTHPEDLDLDLQHLRRMLTGEITSYQIEKRYIHAAGHHVAALLNVSLVHDAQGQPRYFVAQIQDITERKRSEATLRESEAELKETQRLAGVGAWRFEFGTGAVAWSENMFAIFGRDPALGDPEWEEYSQLLTPESFVELKAAVYRTILENEPFEIELETIASCHSRRYMVARGEPARDPGGHMSALRGTVLDITERRLLEQQFLRDQRMESIGTLAGGIAHDLNNTLGPIIMSLDLLKLKFTDASSQELLAIIGSSAQRGADMVRQVLSFARGVEGRRIEVRVEHVVREVEKIVTDTFSKHIEVRAILSPHLWRVIGDPTQLHQVLLNLCVNARDAMPEGGTLTIRGDNFHLEPSSVWLDADAKPGPYVVLRIDDSGTGIPSGVLAKIFDPFFTTKDLGKGTGLGLSTSLAIIKSHGGFMRVDSWSGQGTIFSVYIPARDGVRDDQPAEIAPELPRGNGELILVVDDEIAVRQITRQTLETFGYRVLLASDGEQAAATYAANSKEIAAVITDMMMPVLDGSASIQLMRATNPSVRILGTSGLSTSSEFASTTDLDSDHFLPKPFTAETLLKMLKRILAEKPLGVSA